MVLSTTGWLLLVELWYSSTDGTGTSGLGLGYELPRYELMGRLSVVRNPTVLVRTAYLFNHRSTTS